MLSRRIKYQTVYVGNLTEEFENYVKKENLNTGELQNLWGRKKLPDVNAICMKLRLNYSILSRGISLPLIRKIIFA